MTAPRRRDWLFLFLIALLVAAAAISFVIRSRSTFHQQAAVEAVRKRGGTVVFGPFGKRSVSPDVISADLSHAVVDAELVQTLGQFTGIERLSLDGAKLQPQDWVLLGKLPRLQVLSLSSSNVSDTDVSQLPATLTSLSLRGTAVTDMSMSALAANNRLVNLDLTNTKITTDGLRLLRPLGALKTLSVDEPCITAESAASLQLMQLKSVEVAVPDGTGRQSYKLLSRCKGFNSRGLYRNGCALWTTALPWSDTLAGVIEAVVAEIDLDSQQLDQLLRVLTNPPLENWTAIRPDPLLWTTSFSHSTSLPDRGIEFASADEFIRELQKSLHNIDTYAVRRFAREKFTAGDVPMLMAAIRAVQPQSSTGLEKPCLLDYGPFLVVQHGFDDPKVVAELDRLMTHKYSYFRFAMVFAFGYGGASPFYAPEEWAASEATDAWAVPRLLCMCKDKRELVGIRDVARRLLTEISLRRPEYAGEVMSALVDLLEEGGPWVGGPGNLSREISRVDISRLAVVNADAAIAVVPRLRQMLRQLDEQLADAPAAIYAVDSPSPQDELRRRRFSVFTALSATAHCSPALAHEVALEYLSRLEHGQTAGPFATLLSPETPETNRMVVLTLLNNLNAARGEDQDVSPMFNTGADGFSPLAAIAMKIRDWKTTDSKDD